MYISRRRFLGATGAAGFMSAFSGLGRLSSPLAAPGEDYRALVCVFLNGGLDSHDLVLPYDEAGYQSWSRIRAPVLNQYGRARSRESLLPLSATLDGGRQVALPPEMSGARDLYASGKLAVVGNVGPLIERTNRSALLADRALLPSRLFSHNDQVSTWLAGSPEGAQFGWGGLFADAAEPGSPARSRFTGVVASSNDLFLTGRRSAPFHVGPEGAKQVSLARDSSGTLGEALRSHFLMHGHDPSGLIAQDLRDEMGGAVEANAFYDAATGSVDPTLTDSFPASELGGRLAQVSRAIASRSRLGAHRQIFLAEMGGYDTHSAQATALPRMLAEVDAALTSFQASMERQGLAERVTLFVISEFGRSLVYNEDGTDHGWGGHVLVLGGNVRGGQIIGDIPPPTLEHDLDAGNGRLIPTMAVEQLAATLGAWWGLDEAALDAALPARGRFDRAPLPLF